MKKLLALLAVLFTGFAHASTPSNAVQLSTLGAEVDAINTLLNSGAGTGFIPGTTTSTALISAYPPSTSGGKSALTTDMGYMVCDGVRWNVVGTPPVPPGAAVFSYHHNVFTYFPVLADIGTGNTPGQFKIYSGYLGLNTSEPPVNSTTFTTASNGQLQLHYTATTNGSGIFTIVPFHTSVLASDYGQLGLALGSTGFYAEIAYTDSSNNTDIQDTLFVEPQEHNPLFNDSNPSFPTNYEQWSEYDVNESGHGTDYSGAYRGAYLQWSNWHNGAITLSSAPSSGATTITLASGFLGDTGSGGHPWNITFSTGEVRTAVLVNGSTGPYTLSSALSNNETTAASVGNITLISSSITQTTSVDYTTEHIFGGAYDPIGQTWNIWQDGVFQGSVSTANTNSPNTFRDSLHYMLIVAAQSHGAHFLHTMTVRYIALWTP